MKQYDLIVIGSGPAGGHRREAVVMAAIQAANLVRDVALIERENEVGGACINTGTIPSMPELFPYGIYAIPEISMVGKTEAQLTADGVPYETGVAQYREIARGQLLGDDAGMLKLLIHEAGEPRFGRAADSGGGRAPGARSWERTRSAPAPRS